MVLIEYFNAVPWTTFILNRTQAQDLTFNSLWEIYDLTDQESEGLISTYSEHFRYYTWPVEAAVGGVDSVFGRTGAVTAQSGDYDGWEVTAAAVATNYTPTGATVEGHLAGIDTALWTLGTASTEVVADIAARNALTGLSPGDQAYVTDASADATVDAGAALYVYDGAAWNKIAEFESLDLSVQNFADTDLTLTGARTHDMASNNVSYTNAGQISMTDGTDTKTDSVTTSWFSDGTNTANYGKTTASISNGTNTTTIDSSEASFTNGTETSQINKDFVSITDGTDTATLSKNNLTIKRTTPNVANALPNRGGSIDYVLWDVITESNRIYKCINAHTSSTAFSTDAANWSQISNIDTPSFSATVSTWVDITPDFDQNVDFVLIFDNTSTGDINFNNSSTSNLEHGEKVRVVISNTDTAARNIVFGGEYLKTDNIALWTVALTPSTGAVVYRVLEFVRVWSSSLVLSLDTLESGASLEATKVDASAWIFLETLDASTNLWGVRLFTNIDVANTATLAVQSGETLNGVLDGSFLFSNYSVWAQFRADEVAWGWVINQVWSWVGQVSSRVWEFFYAKSWSTVEWYLAVTPWTVTNGAIDYPVWAAMYPEFIVGNDIVFGSDVEGMFLRNLWWNASTEWVFQADATAPNGMSTSTAWAHTHTFNTHSWTRQAANDFTGVQAHHGSTNGTTSSSGNHSHSIVWWSVETRPDNRAYQLYTIVDTYEEKSLAGMVTPQSLDRFFTRWVSADMTFSWTTPLWIDLSDLVDWVDQVAREYDSNTIRTGSTLTVKKSGLYSIHMQANHSQVNESWANNQDAFPSEIWYSLNWGTFVVIGQETDTNEIDGELNGFEVLNLVVWDELEFFIRADQNRTSEDYIIILDVAQQPTSTVVMPEALSVDDNKVLLWSGTGLTNGQTLTISDTWGNLVNNYESVEFELITTSWSLVVRSTAKTSTENRADGSRVPWIDNFTTTLTIATNMDIAGNTLEMFMTGTEVTAVDVKVYGIKPQKTVINTTDVPYIERTSYWPLTIGGATTSPIKGTVVTDTAYYKVVGKSLFIRYTYNQSTAGSIGSGNYLFPLPTGFSIDTSTVWTVGDGGALPTVLGSAQAHLSGVERNPWTVHAQDANNLMMYIADGENTMEPVGSTWFAMNWGAALGYSFLAEVPIV